MLAMLIGLHQQLPGLSEESIDCPYRVRLLRDRLVTSIDRKGPAGARGDESEDEFANLLAETHAACADEDEDLAGEIVRLQVLHEQALERRHQAAAARAELSRE